MASLSGAEALAERLQRNPDVLYAEPDRIVRPLLALHISCNAVYFLI
jgi:hypothetical protein